MQIGPLTRLPGQVLLSRPRPRAEVTAVAECAVQLSGFKNVDLFSQGIYQVRVRAYADLSGKAAVPFAISELPLPTVPATVNTEQLLPAHILDRTGDVCTPAFRVRYCEEEVVLRLLARFRIELRLVPSAEAAAEALECEDVLLEVWRRCAGGLWRLRLDPHCSPPPDPLWARRCGCCTRARRRPSMRPATSRRRACSASARWRCSGCGCGCGSVSSFCAVVAAVTIIGGYDTQHDICNAPSLRIC